MKSPLVLATAAALLLALPALAAAPAPAVRPAKPVIGKIEPIAPRWEASLKAAFDKMKPGMSNDDVTQLLNTALAGQKGPLVTLDAKNVEAYMLPASHQRAYTMMATYRDGPKRTKNALLAVFQAPEKDYRGSQAKLVNLTLQAVGEPSDISLLTMKPVKVATVHEIGTKTHFKFARPF